MEHNGQESIEGTTFLFAIGKYRGRLVGSWQAGSTRLSGPRARGAPVRGAAELVHVSEF